MIRTLKCCKAWCLDLQPLQALGESDGGLCGEYEPTRQLSFGVGLCKPGGLNPAYLLIQIWKGAVRRFKLVLAGLCDANMSQA